MDETRADLARIEKKMDTHDWEICVRLTNIERLVKNLNNAALIGLETSIEAANPTPIKTVADESSYDFGIWGMWFTQNYGAALTSYAIYKIITDLGYTAELIDYPEIGGEKTASNMDSLDRRFITKHCKTSKQLTKDSVYDVFKECNNFIVPSDSLWGGGYNYHLEALDGVLFGNKLPPNKGILSYATSLGAWTPADEYGRIIERSFIQSLLKNYSSISLRERNGTKLFKDYFDIEVSWNLDPVWLLDNKEYTDLINELVKPSKNYIFAYIMEPTSEKMHFLDIMHEHLGLDVVFVTDMNEDHQQKYHFEKTATWFINPGSVSIEEWLNYLINSNYVITDSYHGMVFSIKYNKEFVTVTRTAMNRFIDLADFLGLSDRIGITSESLLLNLLDSKIDYGTINTAVKQKSESDFENLKFNLSKTIEMQKNKEILEKIRTNQSIYKMYRLLKDW